MISHLLPPEPFNSHGQQSMKYEKNTLGLIYLYCFQSKTLMRTPRCKDRRQWWLRGEVSYACCNELSGIVFKHWNRKLRAEVFFTIRLEMHPFVYVSGWQKEGVLWAFMQYNYYWIILIIELKQICIVFFIEICFATPLLRDVFPK